MGLHKTERIVSIQSARLYCDLCQRAYPQALPPALTLTRADESPARYSVASSEGVFRSPQIPADEDALWTEAETAGWRKLDVCGTPLIVCRDHPNTVQYVEPKK